MQLTTLQIKAYKEIKKYPKVLVYGFENSGKKVLAEYIKTKLTDKNVYVDTTKAELEDIIASNEDSVVVFMKKTEDIVCTHQFFNRTIIMRRCIEGNAGIENYDIYSDSDSDSDSETSSNSSSDSESESESKTETETES